MVQQVQRALLAAIVAAFAFSALSVPSAHAAGGLTLSPTLKDVTLGPGLVETSADVTLTNNTAHSVSVKLKLADLRALGQFGGTSLDKAGLTDDYDLANWMSLPGGDTVVIPANQTVVVKVDIANRTDLTPGGHYGAVVVTADSGNTPKGSVNLNQQLVSLVFVKKLGGEKYGLELKEMLADQADGRLPKTVKLSFVSTGNVHVIPRGYIEVTDPKGKLVAKGIINEDSGLVLPGAVRQFNVSLQPVADGQAAGQYKITAHFRYDGTDEFQTQSIYFTRSGAPRLLLITSIAGALAITIGLVYMLTKKQRESRH